MIDLLKPIGDLLNKILPDGNVRTEAKVKLAELSQKGDDTLLSIVSASAKAANDLNLIDAKSDDKYRTRWRPTIGWVCALGLAWEFLMRPFVVTAVIVFVDNESAALVPSLDTAQIIGLVSSLLGMGALRTYEKHKGKA